MTVYGDGGEHVPRDERPILAFEALEDVVFVASNFVLVNVTPTRTKRCEKPRSSEHEIARSSRLL